MEVNTIALDKGATLDTAILLYGNGHGQGGFISIHDVLDHKGQAILGAGRLANRQSLLELLRTLAGEDETVELLPENILAKGKGYMVWYAKPKLRPIHFSSRDLGGQVSKVVPYPGLIFMATENGWHVFAYKKAGRPNLKTRLYQAPLFNVYTSGNICTGSVKLPDHGTDAPTSAWEDAFFLSWFTHPNVREPGKLLKYETGTYGFWKDMLNGKFQKFPNHVLVSLGVTVQNAFNKIIKRG